MILAAASGEDLTAGQRIVEQIARHVEKGFPAAAFVSVVLSAVGGGISEPLRKNGIFEMGESECFDLFKFIQKSSIAGQFKSPHHSGGRFALRPPGFEHELIF